MKLWGYPLKIYRNKTLHLPGNLARMYRFDSKTKLIRRELAGGFYFRPYSGEQLREGETPISLPSGKITLPTRWMIRNRLTAGKSVLYLTATEDGFYLLTKQEFPATIR